MRQQFVIREYPNGDQEFIDTIQCMRKIAYHNGDMVWMKEGIVIAVQPHDTGSTLRYNDEESTIILDSLSLPKLSREAKAHLSKLFFVKKLRADPEFYPKRFQQVLAKMGLPDNDARIGALKRFLGLDKLS